MMYKPESIARASVIVPVYDEQKIVNDAIARLKNQRFAGQTEIVVVDGDPAAGTLKKITHGDAVAITARKGRGSQMNAGAAASTGQLLLFLHADTRLPAGALEMAAAALSWSSAGAFRLGIDSDRRLIRFIEATANLRSRLLRMPYGDQALFLEREVFFSIGGFRDIPIMEDVEMMLRIRKRRLPFVLLDAKVQTSARRWETEGPLACTLRNWLLLSLFFAGISPDELASRYYRRRPR